MIREIKFLLPTPLLAGASYGAAVLAQETSNQFLKENSLFASDMLRVLAIGSVPILAFLYKIPYLKKDQKQGQVSLSGKIETIDLKDSTSFAKEPAQSILWKIIKIALEILKMPFQELYNIICWAPMKKADTILTWYEGGVNDRGVKFSKLLKEDDAFLEDDHNFIQ